MRIAIMEISAACAGKHADLDPHWEAADWFEEVRKDGRTYRGTLQVIESTQGESREGFLARTSEKANEWDRALACPRCYPREERE